MKVLVTGSNGLLGQKLTDLCVNDPEIELIATSVGANRHPLKKGYTYEEYDIRDSRRLDELLNRYEPDTFIHTAAMTNVDACELDKDGCRALNVEAVGHIVKACTGREIHLIHLSTDFIFDGAAGPYREDDEPNPLSYYGLSKLEAENLIRASGCRSAILRTILVYGVVNDMSRSNIVLWAKGALEKGSPINVVGDQWRMPTLAEDLAACCLLTAKKEAEGVFNVSGKDQMSIIELVERVASFWKLDKSLIKPISSAALNQDARRPARTGFILDKSVRELGYNPHSFEEGLELVDRQLKDRDARSAL